MAPFAPPSHLDWPFFEPRHRAFAAELGGWADAHLPHDHGPDVDAECRALVRSLGDAGWFAHAVGGTAYGGAAETIDTRTICLARETLAGPRSRSASNAVLPQMTLLALSLGHVLSGSILVELVFGYPGLGQQLYRAIQHLDYFVIYGIVFVLICAIALAMLVMDLVYPLLDPRIRHGHR